MSGGLPCGIGVALITPFLEDGTLDEESLHNLLDYLLGEGIDFIVVLGTTGETPTLTAEEQIRIIRLVEDHTNGRIPLIAGAGGNNTRKVAQWIREFPGGSSYVGFLSVTPYYNKPSQRGLIAHYEYLARASTRPIILYNVPGRTGVNLRADTTLKLAEHPTIQGIKEASGDIVQCMRILAGRPAGFRVYSGDDLLNLPYFALGMDGVISVSAHVAPRLLKTMYEAVRTGDLSGAREIHNRLMRLTELLFAEGNPTGVKCALYLRGLIRSKKVRAPLVEGSVELESALRVEMEGL